MLCSINVKWFALRRLMRSAVYGDINPRKLSFFKFAFSPVLFFFFFSEGTVMKTTVINTSKEMTAYSDFPPPVEAANFMHNAQLLQWVLSNQIIKEKFEMKILTSTHVVCSLLSSKL